MATLYLLKYNNYFNRILRREETVDDYKPYLVKYNNTDVDNNGNTNVISNCNFDPNDYLDTQIVANWVGEAPDYLIVTELKKYTLHDDITNEDLIEEREEIIYRWFITDTQKNNFGQHTYILHRDVLAEYITDVYNEPCFIEKATPLSIDDPAIFNSEDMDFNQIKSEEIPLKDETGCPWIIGYIPKNYNGGKITVNYTLKGTEKQTVTSLASWDLYKNTKMCYEEDESKYQYSYHRIINGDWSCYFYLTYKYIYDWGTTAWYDEAYKCNYSSKFSEGAPVSGNSNFIIQQDSSQVLNVTKNYRDNTSELRNTTWYSPIKSSGSDYPNIFYNPAYFSDITPGYMGYTNLSIIRQGLTLNEVELQNDTTFTKFTPQNLYDAAGITKVNTAKWNTLSSWNNKVLRVGSGNDESQYKYYYVQLVPNSVLFKSNTSTGGINITSKLWGGDLNINGAKNPVRAQSGWPASTTNIAENGYEISCYFQDYALQLTEQFATIEVTIPSKDERYHIPDSPYDVFCIPYPQDDTFKIQTGLTTSISADANAGLVAASQITLNVTTLAEGEAQGSTNNLYDLQLLPYCPIDQIKQANGINLTNYQSVPIYKKIGDVSTQVNSMIFCSKTDFELDIPYSIPAGNDVLTKKIKSETEVWRLNSPNYSGIFEFNPQMNDGVEYFHVDCTYRPFSPYIHVAPNFKGLYGGNFEDCRGLICGGDFSLPISSNAWAEYQYNNKNYQQIFDRSIENMEVNNNVSREKEKWQMAAGVINAYAQGKALGGNSMLGLGDVLTNGAAGRSAGLAMAGFSYAAGKRDIELNNQLRAESIDYTKDLFGYQLGNIKALSNSLVKVSAFTFNNKIFPFLEKYTCDVNNTYQTDALKQKLKYNGYTIMRIETLYPYYNVAGSYIKGKLIRLPKKFDAQYHVGVALSNEINKGFYTPEVHNGT